MVGVRHLPSERLSSRQDSTVALQNFRHHRDRIALRGALVGISRQGWSGCKPGPFPRQPAGTLQFGCGAGTLTDVGSLREAGPRILLEEWTDIWAGLLDDIEPTTRAKYKYFVEGHILPAFQGRQIGSLTFEEIEAWDRAIPTQISARGRPYARSVASGARSLLITILGDAVHADRLERNPAERRKGRRGRVRAKGRAPARLPHQATANVITPFQALCLAERCALLSGRGIDFVMNVFATWTGVRWGELMAVEGWEGKDSPLQISDNGISPYAVDWQLRELGGVVRKSPPKYGSYRVLDLPPFLAELMQ